jgi:hypothetical protein
MACLHHAQAGTIEQHGDDPRDAVQVRQRRLHFSPRQDDRQARRALGAHEVVEPAGVLAEDFLVREEDGRERLVLRRRRHPARDGEIGQSGRPRSPLAPSRRGAA